MFFFFELKADVVFIFGTGFGGGGAYGEFVREKKSWVWGRRCGPPQNDKWARNVLTKK